LSLTSSAANLRAMPLRTPLRLLLLYNTLVATTGQIYELDGALQFNLTAPQWIPDFGTNTSNSPEVALQYLITSPENQTRNDYATRLYDGDCENDIAFTAEYLEMSELAPKMNISSVMNVTVGLSILQHKVEESPFFSLSEDQLFGRVNFCVRMIVYYDVNNDGVLTTDGSDYDMEAVTYKDTDVEIYIQMDGEFDVGVLSLDYDSVDSSMTDGAMDYTMLAYQCDEQGNQESTVVSQTTLIYICVSTYTEDIGIHSIYNLEFLQPLTNISSEAITDGLPNMLTTSTTLRNSVNKVQITSSRLVMPFFDNLNGGAQYIKVIGEAILMFQDDDEVGASSRRLKRRRRRLKDNALAPFEVQLYLWSGARSFILWNALLFVSLVLLWLF